MLNNINDSNFNSFEERGSYLLYFYSDTCRYCKTTAPAVESFAEGGNAPAVGKANIAESSGLCSKFRIKSVPTVVYVKDGVEHSRISGNCSKRDIEKAVFGVSEG